VLSADCMPFFPGCALCFLLIFRKHFGEMISHTSADVLTVHILT